MLFVCLFAHVKCQFCVNVILSLFSWAGCMIEHYCNCLILYLIFSIPSCRFNFSTADSSNSVSICRNAGLHEVKRLEKSIRYYVSAKTAPTREQIVSGSACFKTFASMSHAKNGFS